MELQLLQTKDGSHTLYVPELDETYHSRQSSIRESQVVYIERGLQHQVNTHQSDQVELLEIGMGTGLNIWLSMWFAQQHPNLNIRATTLEPFPLPQKLWSQLNFAQMCSDFEGGQQALEAIHLAAWGSPVQLTNRFTLTKQQARLEDSALPQDTFDLLYFDAFAPSKQEAIWSVTNFEKLFAALKPKGWLTTYCASSLLKRNLRHVGFQLHIMRGPLGKREMVCALKP